MPDEELAARIMDHRPLLLRVAAGVVGYEDAEDVAAEAIARAWRGRGGFDGRHLAGWLTVIGRNAGHSWHRARLARPETVELGEGLVAREPGPEATYLRAERDAAIHLAVAHLPARHRQVVTACYLAGLRATNLAALLDCPIATVNTQLHRARAALRQELAGWR